MMIIENRDFNAECEKTRTSAKSVLSLFCRNTHVTRACFVRRDRACWP
jgi:hypothetical protein